MAEELDTQWQKCKHGIPFRYACEECDGALPLIDEEDEEEAEEFDGFDPPELCGENE